MTSNLASFQTRILSLRQRRLLAELVARRKAAGLSATVPTFREYLGQVSPDWTWDWPHLAHIRTHLDRIARGELKRLILSCPPRHGKSEQGTVRFPGWWLEKHPTDRVIIGAYSQSLARKFSRKVKRIVATRIPLSRDQQAVDDWETAWGGGVRAAGVGVGITGMGANLILIDDPVKSRAEAESEVYRERVWDWFRDDLYTRQEPGCAIVLTMTRWHEDDLAGRILASEFAGEWEVINLPAMAEENDPLGRQLGEALCPERFDVKTLENYRTILRRNFYALYQGAPRPAEGNKFKRGWFRYWKREDAELLRLYSTEGRSKLVKLADCRVFITVDLAASLKQQADYTVFAVWAVTPSSDLILLDLVRDQIEEPEVLALATRLYERHRPAYLAVETNGIGLPITQAMRRTCNLPIRGILTQRDKVARAGAATVRVEAGQVYFPLSTRENPVPWLEPFEAELLSFPGAHDDQVDVLSLAAEDVFWGGGAPNSDTVEGLIEEVERMQAEEAYNDPDNEVWWTA